MKSEHKDELKMLGLNIAYYRKYKVLFDICDTLNVPARDMLDFKNVPRSAPPQG